MTYSDFSEFAGTWGLVFLVVMFGVAVIYAIWPSNKSRFEKAAHSPLSDDPAEEKRNGK